ncbi:MAG: HD domain-containing protein [bacterium]|nr:HD domain-containing protein [bacterium]
MITIDKVRKNKEILEFIKQTESVLSALGFTDHGLRHCNLVAQRAKEIAQKLDLNRREIELSAVAGFCHDMANFVSRSYHNYFASLLFHQVFGKKENPEEVAMVMQALANHDKEFEDIAFAGPVSAIAILADKSDVHRSRVIVEGIENIKMDIHDRVNYATESNSIDVDPEKKRIILTLKIDTNFVAVMEYFEIFTERMIFCRKAAQSLGYAFGLVINEFVLL